MLNVKNKCFCNKIDNVKRNRLVFETDILVVDNKFWLETSIRIYE
jgi:hypothetical protein